MQEPEQYPHRAENSITWLVLLRMRVPLLTLIAAYSISILGMVLVPGKSIDGVVTHMDFFHAIYFISYVSTTIGFGELPVSFSDQQRLWAIVTMYLCVIAWIYSLGAILTLMQEPAFRQALKERKFTNQVNKIQQPFYIICGYGETGKAMARTLTHYSIPIVVIDNNQDRINELSLDEQSYKVYVPGLYADTNEAKHLLQAGLRHPLCSRVIALTDDDNTNLKIAITSKLLNPKIKVICRSEDQSISDNMASFGTEYIFNPFQMLAQQLTQALHTPGRYLIYSWLTGISKTTLSKQKPPPQGLWIICGYGRLGRFLYQYLQGKNIDTIVIEPNPITDEQPKNLVKGLGTEAPHLLEAQVDKAVGIVAASNNDTNNLSILMTAQELNPKLYTVARQNKEANREVFEALHPDFFMHTAQILATNIGSLLTSPMLSTFLEHIDKESNATIERIITSLQNLIDEDVVPDIWTITIDNESLLAGVLREQFNLKLEHLLIHPYQHEKKLSCRTLMLKRNDDLVILPDENSTLLMNDKILFCGIEDSYHLMQSLVSDDHVLHEILLGRNIMRSYLLRKLFQQPQSFG